MLANFDLFSLFSESFRFVLVVSFGFALLVLFSVVFSILGSFLDWGIDYFLSCVVRNKFLWRILFPPRFRIPLLKIMLFFLTTTCRLAVLYHELCHLLVAVILFLPVTDFSVGMGEGYVKVKIEKRLRPVSGTKLFFSSIAPALISLILLGVCYVMKWYFLLCILFFPLCIASSLSKKDLTLMAESFPHTFLFVCLSSFLCYMMYRITQAIFSLYCIFLSTSLF